MGLLAFVKCPPLLYGLSVVTPLLVLAGGWGPLTPRSEAATAPKSQVLPHLNAAGKLHNVPVVIGQSPTTKPAKAAPADAEPAESDTDTDTQDTTDTGASGESAAGQLSGPTAGPDEVVTIPKSSAIIVSFPAELILDPKRRHNVPITLPLLQPIVDSEGQIVAPAKSLVSAQLKSMKGGDLIEVTSVVVGGRVIPINALGTLVPAQHKPEDIANPVVPSAGRLNQTLDALRNSTTFTNRLIVDYTGQRRNNLGIFDVADLALSLGYGLTQPVPKIPPAFTNITQGAVYILTLASPVTIPKRLVETGLQIRENLGEEGVVPTGVQ
ncbi:MAG TPA: hypothetical protein V6D19_00120 [Stenomitos sp.]